MLKIFKNLSENSTYTWKCKSDNFGKIFSHILQCFEITMNQCYECHSNLIKVMTRL